MSCFAAITSRVCKMFHSCGKGGLIRVTLSRQNMIDAYQRFIIKDLLLQPCFESVVIFYTVFCGYNLLSM